VDGESRWIPIVAVILLLCLGGTCLIGLVGGNYFIAQIQVHETPARVSATATGTPGSEEGVEEPTPIIGSGSSGPGEQTLHLPGFGNGSDPPTMDPTLSGDTTSAAYVSEIFSGLVVFNKDLELVPDLAEKWDISGDGTVYTFSLRQDATFHDGKQVQAQDFKYSFERACDPATGSTTADTYLGDIVGCRDKLNGKADEVAGVKVVDEHTLEITIDGPKSYFLAKMAYPTAFVLDRENVEKGGSRWADDPNGTGPFKLAEYNRGDSIVLERNENYYREPRPKLEKVYFYLDVGLPMAYYENGDFDATPVYLNDIERVTDPTNPLNKELSIVPQMSVNYIGFNVNEPPFDDANVRRAFNYAVDKEKLAKLVLKKTVEPAYGIVPPTMPGYSNKELEGYEYDPKKAQQLIKDSKYEDVTEFPEITWYTVGAGGTPGQIVEAITAMLRENLGVEVQIQQADWPTFLADLSSPQKPYQMFDLGWVADYPDPQDFLEVLFHSTSTQNHTGYSNPQVDALLDEARSEKDEDKRLELYKKAEQMIIADAPWIPLNFGVDYWLTKPYVKGLLHPPMVIPVLQYVSIER
jgi:oligopeptide transport system substrate-binding protein